MSSEDILFNEKPANSGLIGEVILNRPKALNALTLDMCERFYKQLAEWDKHENIKAIIVKGAGDRSFCAGGDIRKIYEYRHQNTQLMQEFFWHEYRLNALIHHFSKPYFAFLHHITMGGGAGVSINGTYRLAAENLVFAMPETKIGLYPDVGACYFLNQCPGFTGLYLALTGNTIGAMAAKELGLVTHLIPQNQFIQLENTLQNAEIISESLLDTFSLHSSNSELSSHLNTINDCFSENSVELIIRKLENDNDWAKSIADDLKQRSPTSLQITFEACHRAKKMSFKEVMQMNFDLVLQFIKESDFFEGIRTALIDKGQTPQWQPVPSNDKIETYFESKGVSLY